MKFNMCRQFINFVQNTFHSLGNLTRFQGYLTGIAIVLSVIYYWKSVSNWWSRRKRLIKFASKLPGPRALPIIGNGLEFACKNEDILDRIVDVASRYESPFRIWIGPKLFIVTTEPRDYEIILGTESASHKDEVYRFMWPIVGQGILTASGKRHKIHRKRVVPMLSKRTLSIYFKYFDHHSRLCADLLEKEIDCGEFDISSYMAHCTVDIMMDTILGLPGTTQKKQYEDLIYWNERMYEIIHTRMMKVWLHWDKLFFLTKLGKDHDKAVNVIHSFVESGIRRKKEEHLEYEAGKIQLDGPRVMLLEQLINHVARAKDLNDEELRDETYTIFTAAQDTIAVISSFTFLMLAMHPSVQIKVREEINSVVGNEEINEEFVSKLNYLELVIRETVRLYPIAPLLVRQLTGDVALDSCTLPEGCSVVMIPFVTHRSQKYWQEPEKFIPERFLPENSQGRHSFANISFSSGIRGCIGQRFAITCLKTIVANVIRRYQLSSAEKLENLRLKTDISIRSRNGYKVSISKII